MKSSGHKPHVNVQQSYPTTRDMINATIAMQTVPPSMLSSIQAAVAFASNAGNQTQPASDPETSVSPRDQNLTTREPEAPSDPIPSVYTGHGVSPKRKVKYHPPTVSASSI
jgi:hypothetical protein